MCCYCPGKDLPGVVTSDGFFDIETQPKKVAVIGAGYIAVEMAGIFKGLGTETHLFFRGETVLRRGFVRAPVPPYISHFSTIFAFIWGSFASHVCYSIHMP